jgi:hypothetical protein
MQKNNIFPHDNSTKVIPWEQLISFSCETIANEPSLYLYSNITHIDYTDYRPSKYNATMRFNIFNREDPMIEAHNILNIYNRELEFNYNGYKINLINASMIKYDFEYNPYTDNLVLTVEYIVDVINFNGGIGR